MKFIIFLFVGSLQIGCNYNHSKVAHFRTLKLQNGLFVEHFTVYSSGSFGTDLLSDYLTDSLTFRLYVGKFDDGYEYFYYRINGDSINIEKYKSSLSGEGKKLINIQPFLVSALKEMNNYK